jgi:hypothetical protein
MRYKVSLNLRDIFASEYSKALQVPLLCLHKLFLILRSPNIKSLFLRILAASQQLEVFCSSD